MWIGLSKRIALSKIEDMLSAAFPGRSVGVFNDFPAGEWPSICATVTENQSDFPLVFEIHTIEYDQGQNISLAHLASGHFKCRSICDGSGLGDSETPYWCIVWDEGQSYLADDCSTVFGDGEGGPVRIVRAIDLSNSSQRGPGK